MSEEINKKLGDITTSVAVIKTDMKYVRKEIEGNGKKGLITKVEDLETYTDKQKGAIDMIMWIGGFIGIGNIVSAVVYWATK